MRIRRGSTLLELAVSIMMVGVLLAISVQVLGWTVRERRATDRRAAALVEAGNLMDGLTRLPWNDVTQEGLVAAKLSGEADAMLPDAKLDVTLRQPEDDPTAKQITVSIDWLGDHQQREAPARITAWVFK